MDVPEHILTSVIGPDGVAIMQVGFDASGRIIKVRDARGDSSSFSYTFEGPTVGLPAGYTVESVIDDRGVCSGPAACDRMKARLISCSLTSA